jgi:hypothetical protein
LPEGANVGHAHAIVVDPEHGTVAGAADARAGASAAVGA